jgi:2-polyprenyl-3-methyl-5-hydroxy-6-metoxy-1,4-benzoquinol methylase
MDQTTGWLKIPGVQDGARTLEEQMLGLGPVLEETAGKTILDLGCAEGTIALEFARAGAKSIDACDYNEPFIEVAKQQYEQSGLTGVRFKHADITELMAKRGTPKRYDIVLALAILHKLPDPDAAIRFCAQSARSLIVIRLPINSVGAIRSKHGAHLRADIREILPEMGFIRERKEVGPRGEWVHYWRRKE